MAEASERSVESLTEVFKCFICMEKLRDARLCPHCSKLCCLPCITRWLTEQRSQCPHCRAPLHVHELVNCRWVNDVTQQLDSLQNINISFKSDVTDDNRCDLHKDKLTVFCVTCKRCICHHCALWDANHSGHEFKPVDGVYDEHISKVLEQIKLLKRRHIELIGLIQDVERNVEEVKSSKDKRVREIRTTVELMITRLDSVLKGKLLNLLARQRLLMKDADSLETLIEDVEDKVSTCSKSEFILKSHEIMLSMSRVNTDPESIYLNDSVSPYFTSEIVPVYDWSLFTMKHFSVLQQRADPVYSQHLQVGGLSWRLKVYPDGNGVVRGSYLSIFLELFAGFPESSKYEYRIEMVHQASGDQSKSIVREFASDFEVGECWGYNRFFRLDLLASEGYHNTRNDTLTLKFFVRPPTYYQKSRDQQWYISQMESNQSLILEQIKVLKSQLVKELCRRRNTSSKSDVNNEIAKVETAASGIFDSLAGSLPEQIQARKYVSVTDVCSLDTSDSEDLSDGDLDENAFGTGNVKLSSLASAIYGRSSGNDENDVDAETMSQENDVDNLTNQVVAIPEPIILTSANNDRGETESAETWQIICDTNPNVQIHVQLSSNALDESSDEDPDVEAKDGDDLNDPLLLAFMNRIAPDCDTSTVAVADDGSSWTISRQPRTSCVDRTASSHSEPVCNSGRFKSPRLYCSSHEPDWPTNGAERHVIGADVSLTEQSDISFEQNPIDAGNACACLSTSNHNRLFCLNEECRKCNVNLLDILSWGHSVDSVERDIGNTELSGGEKYHEAKTAADSSV